MHMQSVYSKVAFIFLPINSGQVLSLRDARYSLTWGKIGHLRALYRIVVDRKYETGITVADRAQGDQTQTH